MNAKAMSFDVHPQLSRDSIHVIDLSLCQLRLINDARFRWLILVPKRAEIVEWFDLNEADQRLLHEETMRIASWLKADTGCSKINIGALGNMVRQLHVHIIARHENDACWPRPVWGSAMEPMPEQQLESICVQIRKSLARES
jgi:diadenosine tetraphosphate (Ap4A) HIT family hydrolase